MTPERWRQIEALYYAARDRDHGDRPRFLDEACGDDRELRREVESLLDQPRLDGMSDLIWRLAAPSRERAEFIGHYRVTAKLGEGGMGEVYRATDTKLNREVAIKVLPEVFAADPDRMARFRREAQVLASLNHPNIAVIHSVEERALVLELVEGPTLAERIAKGPIPLDEALSIAGQIAEALECAHNKGIIHRDLKPANIKLTPEGRVKVLDFGLAKAVPRVGTIDAVLQSSVTTTVSEAGVIMGTPSYMAPEQARGETVDRRADIWSFGVVLYEMLTGRQLFGGSGIDAMTAVLTQEPEWQHVPPKTQRLLRRCLEKDPKRRLRDIGDWAELLEGETRPTRRTREDKAVSVTWLRLPQKQLRSLGIVLGILLLVGGAIAYAWWQRADGLSQPQIKSLAVLPLKSLDAGENYLGLGIADAAISRVSQTGRLIVRPTSAVRRYLNEDTDALTAAKQLGVDSVLEGSFQRADDRLRVSVNLLRSRDGASLWTDRFELRMADIFTIQDTVAQQVASRLRLQLDASQQAQLTKRYTSNPIAYEFYLIGAYAYNQRMFKGDPLPYLERAIDLLKKAIDADPNFALAHAQLAYVYATRAAFFSQPAWVALANEEIKHAEELDPQLAETHLVRFQLLYSEFEGYQGEAAVREVQLANQLNPNVGHGELAYLYSHLGLEDLAARELKRAFEIDPTSDELNGHALLMYEVQSNYDGYAANQSIRRTGRSEAWYFMGKGQLDKAQRTLDEWPTKQPSNPNLPGQFRPTKALLLAVKGDFRAAEAEIPLIRREHPLKDPLYHHAAYDIACIYALEGKSDQAVQWLREAAVAGYHLYPRYQRDAFLNRIRQAPEFIQFLAEMKAENDRYRHEFS